MVVRFYVHPTDPDAPAMTTDSVTIPTIAQAHTAIQKLRDVAHAFSMLVIAIAAAYAALKPAAPAAPPTVVVPASTPAPAAIPAAGSPPPATIPGSSVTQVREDVILAGSVQTYEKFLDAVADRVLAKTKAATAK